jgi:hypothetical protein
MRGSDTLQEILMVHPYFYFSLPAFIPNDGNKCNLSHPNFNLLNLKFFLNLGFDVKVYAHVCFNRLYLVAVS